MQVLVDIIKAKTLFSEYLKKYPIKYPVDTYMVFDPLVNAYTACNSVCEAADKLLICGFDYVLGHPAMSEPAKFALIDIIYNTRET